MRTFPNNNAIIEYVVTYVEYHKQTHNPSNNLPFLSIPHRNNMDGPPFGHYSATHWPHKMSPDPHSIDQQRHIGLRGLAHWPKRPKSKARAKLASSVGHGDFGLNKIFFLVLAPRVFRTLAQIEDGGPKDHRVASRLLGKIMCWRHSVERLIYKIANEKCCYQINILFSGYLCSDLIL